MNVGVEKTSSEFVDQRFQAEIIHHGWALPLILVPLFPRNFEVEPFHHLIKPWNGQSNNIKVATIDSFHKARPESLNRIGTCLVEGLTRLQVGLDFQIGQVEKSHVSCRRILQM